jgi:hypothetical protein
MIKYNGSRYHACTCDFEIQRKSVPVNELQDVVFNLSPAYFIETLAVNIVLYQPVGMRDVYGNKIIVLMTHQIKSCLKPLRQF